MRIGLLRESGGLGDIVMTGGVVRRLKEEGHNIFFLGFKEYQDAVTHIGYDGMFELDPNIRSRRRDRADITPVYNSDYECLQWLPLDKIYSLFCPGYTHESIAVRRLSPITINRVEAFQVACGYVKDFVRQKWTCTKEELEIAQRWIDYRGIKNEKLITMHLRATDVARSYVKHKALHIALKEKGYYPVVVDSINIDDYKDLDTFIWREPLWLKVAIMQLSRAFIGVDSGFFHIACGLGLDTYSLWGPTNAEQTTKLYETNTSIKISTYDESTHIGIPKADEHGIACKPPCIHSPEMCRKRTGCKYLNDIEITDIINILEKK